MDNNELYHHGIKGQKWGVRRYQNEDGSLKPAGKKRYGSDGMKDAKKAVAKVVKSIKKTSSAAAQKVSDAAKNASEALKAHNEKVKAEKQAKLAKVNEVKKSNALKNKPISEMTDVELKAAIARLQLENSYRTAMSQATQASNTVSVGKKIANALSNTWSKSISPAIGEATKNVLKPYLEKTLKDRLGLDDDNKNKKRQEYADELAREAKIAQNKEIYKRYTGKDYKSD